MTTFSGSFLTAPRIVPVPHFDVHAKLTARQVQIISLVAAGQTNEEIAEALGVSANTIRSHLRRIYQNLDVWTRLESVLVAIALGYLTVEKAA